MVIWANYADSKWFYFWGFRLYLSIIFTDNTNLSHLVFFSLPYYLKLIIYLPQSLTTIHFMVIFVFTRISNLDNWLGVIFTGRHWLRTSLLLKGHSQPMPTSRVISALSVAVMMWSFVTWHSIQHYKASPPKSEIVFTKDTPLLTPKVYCEYFRDNWRFYNVTALYWNIFSL